MIEGPTPDHRSPPRLPQLLRISRRGVLAAGGVAVAATLAGTVSAAVAAPIDMGLIRARWVDRLTGRRVIDPDDPAVRAAIAALDAAADEAAALVAGGDARPLVFTDLPLAGAGAELNIVLTYRRLATLATAWATPGSTREADTATLALVITGLDDCHRLAYNAQQEEFGGWWAWEIGSPKSLTDTMAIVADHLTPQQLADYAAAIDHFVPDPHLQYPTSRGQIVSKGANRVDLCQAVIIRSIVVPDPDRLAHAADGLADVWEPVTDGNGFYADGSFIQHNTVPYTGTYGVILLNGLALMFALLTGSPSEIDDPSRERLFDSVEASFAPVVHDGQMMDCVRGRAVSRQNETALFHGHAAVRAVLQLADAVPEATAQRWRGLCRGWIERNSLGSIQSGATVYEAALVSSLLASDVAALPEQAGPTLFHGMDRVIHRGDGWAAALSMCSTRTSWYENGNGENVTAYHSGSGMTYFYPDSDPGHFDDGFWPTADLNRVPGITVDTTPLPDGVEGGFGSRTPRNRWAGGVSLGPYAMIGHRLQGPGGTGLTANKSWFFTDEMVVCLGAGIATDTDATVESVIEQRNLGEAGRRRLLIDGRRLLPGSEPSRIDGARWAALEGIAGYVFLDTEGLRALQGPRTGSWSEVTTSGSTEPLTREFATLWVDHGPGAPHTTYGYVVLPGADAGRTARWARRSPVEVVANTARAHAIRSGPVEAACLWQPGEAGPWQAGTPASVIAERTPGRLRLAVADPTHQLDQVTVWYAGAAGLTVQERDGVAVTPDGDSVRFDVRTAGLGGHGVEIVLDA